MYTIEKNILPKEDLSRIKFLLKILHWKCVPDTDFEVQQPYGGMSRLTFNEPIGETEKELNDFAQKITDEICKRKNMEFDLLRVTWNFYKRFDSGMKWHLDTNSTEIDVKKYWSVLYSLNNSDGYLQINKDKIIDVENEAKIFPSNLLHKGFPPVKDFFRINLNLVLKEKE